MTKQELIELIEHNLSGGDTVVDLRGRYDPRIISYHIGMVFNQIFYDTFRLNPTGLDLYAQEYTVDILCDNGQYYSNLPNSLVQMPRDAGMRQIRSNVIIEESETFKPMTAQSISLMSRGDLGEFTDDTWYYIRGTKVYYAYADADITSVKMLMLVPFQNLDDEDEIYIPSGKEDEFFQLVIQKFRMQPEDTRNDNVSKQI